MSDNFDLRKYLIENKVTTNSKLVKEIKLKPNLGIPTGRKNITFQVYVELIHGEPDFLYLTTKSEPPYEVAKQKEAKYIEYNDGEKDEFMGVYEVSKGNMYIVTEGQEGYYVIGNKRAPKWGKLWDLLLPNIDEHGNLKWDATEAYEAAASLVEEMSLPENSKEV